MSTIVVSATQSDDDMKSNSKKSDFSCRIIIVLSTKQMRMQ